MKKLFFFYLSLLSSFSFSFSSYFTSQTAYTLPKRLLQTSLFTTSYGVTESLTMSNKTVDMVFGTFDFSFKYSFSDVFKGLTLAPEFRFIHGRGGVSFLLNAWASYRLPFAPISLSVGLENNIAPFEAYDRESPSLAFDYNPSFQGNIDVYPTKDLTFYLGQRNYMTYLGVSYGLLSWLKIGVVGVGYILPAIPLPYAYFSWQF